MYITEINETTFHVTNKHGDVLIELNSYEACVEYIEAYG